VLTFECLPDQELPGNGAPKWTLLPNAYRKDWMELRARRGAHSKIINYRWLMLTQRRCLFRPISIEPA